MKKLVSYVKFVIIASILLSTTNYLNAQLFKAGVAVGFNVSQIEGDDMNGYRKFGANIGVLSDVNFNDKMAVGLEILYSQKGSRGYFEDGFNVSSRKIILDYIEIPILFKYKDTKGMDFGAGISLAQVVRKKSLENDFDNTDDYFSVTEMENNDVRKTDFNILLDASYNINSMLALGVRWSYSLGRFQTQYSGARKGRAGQFHNVLALRLLVFFNAQSEKSNL